MPGLKFIQACLMASSISALTIFGITGCGGGSSNPSSTPGIDQNYSGPGSKWDLTLAGDGTFNIDHYQTGDLINPDYTVQGNYTRESSGFVTLTTTGGTGTGYPPPGSTAWAVEVPGFAFMLKPVGDDQIIPMIEAGNCPTSNYLGNFVVVKKDLTNNGDSGADLANRDFFGSFTFDVSTSVTTLNVLKSLTAGFPDTISNAVALEAGTCSQGVMSLSSSVVYLTTSGGGIVHLGTDTPSNSADDSFLFALEQKAITNISNLDGTYAGILFDQNSSPGQQIQPVKLSCTSGSCSGSLVSDVVTGATVPNSTASVNLLTVDTFSAPGLMTGSVSYGGSTGNMACVADINANSTGKKIISCVAQSPDNNANMFNVIFVSI